MNYLNRLKSDFSNGFMQNIKVGDILLVVFLLLLLMTTFYAENIAQKLTSDENKQVNIKLIIKSICIVVVSITAIIIMF